MTDERVRAWVAAIEQRPECRPLSHDGTLSIESSLPLAPSGTCRVAEEPRPLFAAGVYASCRSRSAPTGRVPLVEDQVKHKLDDAEPLGVLRVGGQLRNRAPT